MSIWSLIYQQSIFKRYHSDQHFSEFFYNMAAKIHWHRYGTKLRQCHPMYSVYNELRLQLSITLLTYLLLSCNNRLPVNHTYNKGNKKWATPRRLYILCWRELSWRYSMSMLLPEMSPAAGHLTAPTVTWLPGLCEYFRPTPRVAQFDACWVHIGLLALSGQE